MKNQLNNDDNKLRDALKGNENPFTAPSGYFEELPGKIADRINSLPDFEKASVVNPFKVPADYFEDLPAFISEKINNKKSNHFSWLSNLLRPRIVIPVAFAVIVLLAGLYFNRQPVNNFQHQEEFTAEDLQNSNYLQTIDDGLFVEILDKQKTDTTFDSYEQYLIDNNIEISQIEKEL